MILKQKIFNTAYNKILRPLLFMRDPEKVHDGFTYLGEKLSNYPISRNLVELCFSFKNPTLCKTVNGITFENPVGLAAGFDYDGRMVKIMKSIGFGFNTVGTVTSRPYAGNELPRLARLVKSKSLLVNKGFKSLGVHEVVKKLNDPYLKNVNFGVSVGSSNVPEVNTVDLAIADYVDSFTVLETSPYIKYYELNISCPNTAMPENFTIPINFKKLVEAVMGLNLSRPVFVKMPNEIDFETAEILVKTAFDFGINSFIFSNLVKNRENSKLLPKELEKVESLKGNFSGAPVLENAIKLVSHFRQMYGDKIVLVGCGGILSLEDAQKHLDAGADLLQLITGMIFNGPQFIGEINHYLSSKAES